MVLLVCKYMDESGTSEAVVLNLPKTESVNVNPVPLEDQAAKNYNISLREKQVLELLAQGYNTHEVAELLILSPKTVENHAENIAAKLGAHGRGGHIAKAFELGILDREKISKIVAETAKNAPTPENVYSKQEPLSPREKQLLQLKYGRGGTPVSNKELAAEVGLSYKTIEYYLENATRKLSAKNSATAWLICSAQEEAQKPSMLEKPGPLERAA